jgi:hypothetical protein
VPTAGFGTVAASGPVTSLLVRTVPTAPVAPGGPLGPVTPGVPGDPAFPGGPSAPRGPTAPFSGCLDRAQAANPILTRDTTRATMVQTIRRTAVRSRSLPADIRAELMTLHSTKCGHHDRIGSSRAPACRSHAQARCSLPLPSFHRPLQRAGALQWVDWIWGE